MIKPSRARSSQVLAGSTSWDLSRFAFTTGVICSDDRDRVHCDRDQLAAFEFSDTQAAPAFGCVANFSSSKSKPIVLTSLMDAAV
jgi:hypothetical protein